MNNYTELIVAITGLVGALNLILNTMLRYKMKELTRNVNGRTSELIDLHRREAYNTARGLNENKGNDQISNSGDNVRINNQTGNRSDDSESVLR